MKEELNKQLWNMSRPAVELPRDWLVIPTLDVIQLLKLEEQTSGDKK